MRLFSLLSCAIAALGVAGGSALANECRSVASASYSATRTISGPRGGETMKIYVSGDRQREESDRGGKQEVRITSGRGAPIIVFIPADNVGIRIPPPPRGKAAPGVRKQKQADGSTLLTMQIDLNGTPQTISEVVCRADGVLIEARHREMTASGPGGVTTVRDSGVVVGPQPAALFKVPAGVQFKR